MCRKGKKCSTEELVDEEGEKCDKEILVGEGKEV